YNTKSINPPENVNPTPTFKKCMNANENAAKTQCTPKYNNGEANKNENSRGSVIPVNTEVKDEDVIKPLTSFLRSGLAVWYIAKAAAGKPKIMNGNIPEKNLAASAPT